MKQLKSLNISPLCIVTYRHLVILVILDLRTLILQLPTGHHFCMFSYVHRTYTFQVKQKFPSFLSTSCIYINWNRLVLFFDGLISQKINKINPKQLADGQNLFFCNGPQGYEDIKTVNIKLTKILSMWEG